MKLALILKHLANNDDATQWIRNVGNAKSTGVRYKGLSDNVLLIFYPGSEDELIQKLQQGLSGESSFAVYALNGMFFGLGSAEHAAKQVQSLFDD